MIHLLFCVQMLPKYGRGARAATQPRMRTVSPDVSNESVHYENIEVVPNNMAQAEAPQVNGHAAYGMAMFEEFCKFQEYMRRKLDMREHQR